VEYRRPLKGNRPRPVAENLLTCSQYQSIGQEP